MRIHPVQRKTFLDVELMGGILFENDLVTAVDGHDRDFVPRPAAALGRCAHLRQA